MSGFGKETQFLVEVCKSYAITADSLKDVID